MKKLENNKLKEITGGFITLKAASLIGAGIVFIIGVVDGFVRPLKCN